MCTPEVREAKEISALITEKADIEIFEDDDEPFVLGFSKSSDESVSRPRTVTTTTNSGDTEVDSSISQCENTSQRPIVASPKLQRVSHPRRKTNEDMTMQDFFKYSMMMREADRKKRMEEARGERKRREEDDRMFQNLFLGAIMNGKTTKYSITDLEPNTK